MSKLRTLCIAAILVATAPVRAHNPDTSYLRCVVSKHGIELRFTLDIATIFRITRANFDGDGRVTREEFERIAPEVFAYLEEAVVLEINGEESKLTGRLQPGWPVEAGDAVLEKDYHQQLVHFPFRVPSPELIEDFTLTYDVFAELGDAHHIVADIEQEGRHLPVTFSQIEPDYVYDTGWTPELKAAARISEQIPEPRASTWLRSYLERIWSATPIILLFALVVVTKPRPWIPVMAALGVFGLFWEACLMGCDGSFHPPSGIAALASALSLLLMTLIFQPLSWVWCAIKTRLFSPKENRPAGASSTAERF